MDAFVFWWLVSNALEMHSRRASVAMEDDDDASPTPFVLESMLVKLARQVWYVVEDITNIQG